MEILLIQVNLPMVNIISKINNRITTSSTIKMTLTMTKMKKMAWIHNPMPIINSFNSNSKMKRKKRSFHQKLFVQSLIRMLHSNTKNPHLGGQKMRNQTAQFVLIISRQEKWSRRCSVLTNITANVLITGSKSS